MTDFRVSHDPRRQTDSSAVRFEQCGWKLLAQFVVERGGGESDGVAVSGGRVTPPVDYDQRERSAFRSEEHTSELQSQSNLVCRLLLEKKNIKLIINILRV